MTRSNLLKSPLLVLVGVAAGCGPRASTTPDVVTVTFDVDVPDTTPETASVYIIGNHANLGNDSNDAGLKLNRVTSTKFNGSVYLPMDSQIIYKVRMKDSAGPAGSELNASGSAVAPRTLNVGDEATTIPVSVSQWQFEGPSLPPNVTFVVTVPSNTPASADLYIPGSAAELGPWNPANAGSKLTKQSDGTYKITIKFTSVNSGDTIQFKTTRGSWDNVEKKPDGSELDNRTWKLRGGDQTVPFTVARWADLPAP